MNQLKLVRERERDKAAQALLITIVLEEQLIAATDASNKRILILSYNCS